MVVLWWLWARGGGDGEWRVAESECRDRRDRAAGIIFEVGRKSPPENFSGGGGVVAVVAGGWPAVEMGERVGHLTRDYRSPAATNNQRILTCYECGNQGHYRSDCPELKNQNHGNQAGGTGAQGMVHALGGGETNQDLNDMENDTHA
ncbi:putative reverse transcriptase domain-containing protein [Tanacetum coccineum]